MRLKRLSTNKTSHDPVHLAFARWTVFSFLLFSATACIHPKIRFHKARLLDPMMDPAKSEGLQTSFRAEPSAWNERGSGDAGSAAGGSCPTCSG